MCWRRALFAAVVGFRRRSHCFGAVIGDILNGKSGKGCLANAFVTACPASGAFDIQVEWRCYRGHAKNGCEMWQSYHLGFIYLAVLATNR